MFVVNLPLGSRTFGLIAKLILVEYLVVQSAHGINFRPNLSVAIVRPFSRTQNEVASLVNGSAPAPTHIRPFGMPAPPPKSGGYASPYPPPLYPSPELCPPETFHCTNTVPYQPFHLYDYPQTQRQYKPNCLPDEKVCDQIKDCAEADDEAETLCDCLTEPGYYRCRGKKEKCIPESWLCDSVSDCPYGDDELPDNCKLDRYSCLTGENRTGLTGYYPYQSSRKSIPSKWLCDGQQDCNKGDDEKFCPSPYPKALCKPEQFGCKGTSICLDAALICDNIRHCPKGDDENDCNSNEIVVSSPSISNSPLGATINDRIKLPPMLSFLFGPVLQGPQQIVSNQQQSSNSSDPNSTESTVTTPNYESV